MSRCLSCGEIIPEGRQVCWKCEHSCDGVVSFITVEAVVAYLKRCGDAEACYEVRKKDGRYYVRRVYNDWE